jgi:hypothetical protein
MSGLETSNGPKRPTVKLYDVPRNTLVFVPDLDEYIWFDHIDGMYSFCKDMDGNIRHLAAWTEVEIDDEPEVA